MYYMIIEFIMAVCTVIMTGCLITLVRIVKDDWKRLKRLERLVYGKRDNRTR